MMPCLLVLFSLDLLHTIWCRLVCRNSVGLNFIKTGLKCKFGLNPQSFSHELCLYITRFYENYSRSPCNRSCGCGQLARWVRSVSLKSIMWKFIIGHPGARNLLLQNSIEHQGIYVATVPRHLRHRLERGCIVGAFGCCRCKGLRDSCASAVNEGIRISSFLTLFSCQVDTIR